MHIRTQTVTKGYSVNRQWRPNLIALLRFERQPHDGWDEVRGRSGICSPIQVAGLRTNAEWKPGVNLYQSF